MPIEGFYFLSEDRVLQKQMEWIKWHEWVKVMEGGYY